jgi:hypothetical protein
MIKKLEQINSGEIEYDIKVCRMNKLLYQIVGYSFHF